MSRNRRRSTQRAEIEEQVAELPEESAEVSPSRRRSAQRAETEEQVAELPPPQSEANRSRRRSAWPTEPPSVTGERQHEEHRTASVGALSGQLPPGMDHQPGVIATPAGRYLRQAARDDAPARLGTPPSDIDDAARRVWEIAFGLAVRRRFEPETPLTEISRTVATAVHEHAVAGLPILDAEMLVRHALGETVPIGDIDGSILLAVHLLLFASLADELALGDEELDAIIADAEEKAASLVPA
ncbi:hypothetical protein [Paractinoplanes toevensis]|uniref:Uncharacterized protein n=1 Tax=Paractinoplanes toevensis TaxID=571911 RepID=A0A920BR09_9ACTN|nr:hypothetical protein [Actinoplanes toevensis]GIM97904.1 hypothetical protein Ato02nite_096970 [Actinoplanes toevensis]